MHGPIPVVWDVRVGTGVGITRGTREHPEVWFEQIQVISWNPVWANSEISRLRHKTLVERKLPLIIAP